MEWLIKSFDELTPWELYKILQLRINVFMLEQNCLYPECDNKDFHGKHLFVIQDEECVAYARLLPPDISYPGCSSIGRVVVHQNFRNKDYGKLLMEQAIASLKSDFPNHPICISAQQYLLKFYSGLGFKQESEMYLEDNIPHIRMGLSFIEND